jgi:metal-responsive CopG/Arc/MetJ family transcriptional regulator
MNSIQITVDEALLARLDADPEVERSGRSAVIRRAVDVYLRQRRTHQIDEAYRKAYGKKPGLGADWKGWTEEAVWPEE